METTSLTTNGLSKNQQIILEMLVFMQKKTSETQVKSADEIITRFKLPKMYGTILRNTKIINKDKLIKWNPAFEPTEALAIDVEHYCQLYPKLMELKKAFKNYFNSAEKYPFPFKNIWEQLEYDQYWNAKRALLSICENGVDFVNLIDEAKSPQNGQNDGLSDNFMLSKVGLFTFLNASQKPWAKFVARTMFELDQEAIMFLRKLSSGVIMIAEKANLLNSADVAIMHLKNEYREIEKQIHSTNMNPQLLLIPIEEGYIRKKISGIWDDAKRIAMEIYEQEITIYPEDQNKQLEITDYQEQ